jgi:4-diphosphocytidyl-2-C-methyl-D-erythritol kinase
MVELALQELRLAADVEIHIEKRLPVQGGLGAGSANAVAALLGLEHELATKGRRDEEAKTDWPAQRLELAGGVGSDVPLFLIGGTILGLDRGQQVYPLPDIDPTWCVVVSPPVGVSTPLAFRDWDELCSQQGLTAEASTGKLDKLSRAYASAFAGAFPEANGQAGSSGVPAPEIQTGSGDLAGPQESALVRTGITSWIQNDFERVVFPQHPSLAEIKRILAAEGTPEAALYASLSGSGSALFGLYLTRGAAEAACERLRSTGVTSFLTRTVNRETYWGQMLLT